MATLLIPGAIDPMKRVFILSGNAPPTTNVLAGTAFPRLVPLGGGPPLKGAAEDGGSAELMYPGGPP